MGTCPRCGDDLERYELWGREQLSCSDCGYVGVPVDHKSDREAPESWGTAIRRFKEKFGDDAPSDETRGPSPPVPPEADDDGEGDAAGREAAGEDHGREESRETEPAEEATPREDDATGTDPEEEAGGRQAATADRPDSRRTALLRRKKRRER